MKPSNDLLKVVRENMGKQVTFMTRDRRFKHTGIIRDDDFRKFHVSDGTYYDILNTRSDGAIACPRDYIRGWGADSPGGRDRSDLVAIFEFNPEEADNVACLAVAEGYKPNDKV